MGITALFQGVNIVLEAFMGQKLNVCMFGIQPNCCPLNMLVLLKTAYGLKAFEVAECHKGFSDIKYCLICSFLTDIKPQTIP